MFILQTVVLTASSYFGLAYVYNEYKLFKPYSFKNPLLPYDPFLFYKA